jgi:hypothetical protein
VSVTTTGKRSRSAPDTSRSLQAGRVASGPRVIVRAVELRSIGAAETDVATTTTEARTTGVATSVAVLRFTRIDHATTDVHRRRHLVLVTRSFSCRSWSAPHLLERYRHDLALT